MSRIVLGIDPGSRITGYGIIEVHGSQLQYIASGCIKPDAKDFLLRLGEIYSGVTELITRFAPDELAIEDVFVAANPSSALKLGQARGVAIAAAVAGDLAIFEYAPRKVKRAVVGTGTAAKSQIQHMVQVLLSLSGEPSEDSADALAIGICHVNTALGEAKTNPINPPMNVTG